MENGFWEYLWSLRDSWAAWVGAVLFANELVMLAFPSYRRMVEEKIPQKIRLLLVMLIFASGLVWASYGVWQSDQKRIAAQTSCVPKIEWGQEKPVGFDPILKAQLVERRLLVTRLSRHDFGLYVEARGDGLVGLFATATRPRSMSVVEKDKARIQLKPSGIAHYLFNAEGAISVLASTRNPSVVRFRYRVECFE